MPSGSTGLSLPNPRRWSRGTPAPPTHQLLAGVLTAWTFFADDGCFHRTDLTLEATFGHSHSRLLLGLEAEPIDISPRDAVLGSDALGCGELVGHVVAQVFGDGPSDTGGGVGSQRHPARRFNAAGDADIDGPGRHQVVDEVVGLLGRSALAVHRGGGHFIGETVEQPGRASDVESLLPSLGHTTADHLLHDRRIDARTLDHFNLGRTQNVGSPEAREPSIALANRSMDSASMMTGCAMLDVPSIAVRPDSAPVAPTGRNVEPVLTLPSRPKRLPRAMIRPANLKMT